jgi:hypothetical protein
MIVKGDCKPALLLGYKLDDAASNGPQLPFELAAAGKLHIPETITVTVPVAGTVSANSKRSHSP